MTVIASSRVAELRAIFFLSGWSSAVIDSTARLTKRALSKPSTRPTPKKTPMSGLPPPYRRAATAIPVSTAQMTSNRTGRKATAGNTNGASCAGVVTASPRSRGSMKGPFEQRCSGACPTTVSKGDGRAGITQGVAPFVGRKSAPIGLLNRWAGPATREVFRVLPAPYHMVDRPKQDLLLFVVQLVWQPAARVFATPQKRNERDDDGHHDGGEHDRAGVARVEEDGAGGTQRDDAHP